MEFSFFSTLSVTLLSLLSGITFGFLLRKATVSRFDTIVGQLLLQDFTVMKVILTAILVGSSGIYFLNSLDMIPSLHLSKTPILFSIIGGGIFGVGMSIAGYCPGTAIAAIAEGAKDMIFGLFGMLIGAVLFNQLSPVLRPYLEEKDSAVQETIASYFGISYPAVILGLAFVWAVFALAVKKFEQKRSL